jgi:hypothetical protein
MEKHTARIGPLNIWYICDSYLDSGHGDWVLLIAL